MAKKAIKKIDLFKEQIGETGTIVGVDVHKNSYAVCVVGCEVDASFCYTTSLTNKKFVEDLLNKGFNIKKLVYECGPTGFKLAWACNEYNIPVRVVNPLKMPRYACVTNKNDKSDSIKLAYYEKSNMNLDFCTIYIPTEDEEGIKAINAYRETIKEDRAKAIKRLKSKILCDADFDLSEYGKSESWSSNLKNFILCHTTDTTKKINWVLRKQIDDIDTLTNNLKEANKELSEIIRKYYPKERDNMLSISGVGFILTNVILSEIPNLVNRFPTFSKFANYCGLSPIIRESGLKTGKDNGFLEKANNKRIQPYLIQCAWIFKNLNYEANEYYKKKLAKKIPVQKIIINIARQLLKIIYSVLKHERKYIECVHTA